MSTIRLPFGKESLTADIPDNRLSGIMLSGAPQRISKRSEETVVRDALAAPLGSQPLRELVKGKKKIVIIADSHMELKQDRIILPLLLEEILEGSPEADISVLLEAGFPYSKSKADLIQKFGKPLSEDPRIHYVIHFRENYDEMRFLGILPSGAELKINRIAAEADLLIAESYVAPDYITGYTGGGCSILPGIASRASFTVSRSSRIVDDRYTRPGILDKNPAHADVLDAARKAKLAFAVNVVLNSSKRIISAAAGDFEKVQSACIKCFESHSKLEPIPSDIILTTGGGFPLDRTICQALRGLIPAEIVCKQSGVIILAADCRDGAGHSFVYETFARQSSRERIMLRLLATMPGETILHQWEAQILCRILIQFTVIMVTNAPEQIVRDMHMEYAPTLEQAIVMADDYLGRKYHHITVIPDGTSIVVLKQAKKMR